MSKADEIKSYDDEYIKVGFAAGRETREKEIVAVMAKLQNEQLLEAAQVRIIMRRIGADQMTTEKPTAAIDRLRADAFRGYTAALSGSILTYRDKGDSVPLDSAEREVRELESDLTYLHKRFDVSQERLEAALNTAESLREQLIDLTSEHYFYLLDQMDEAWGKGDHGVVSRAEVNAFLESRRVHRPVASQRAKIEGLEQEIARLTDQTNIRENL